MADGFIVRRGGVKDFIEKAETPTINFVSSTTTSITFTIKNNDAQTAVILWERDDTTPDANSLELAAGVTSSNLTISGLTEGDLLTIYATANVTEKIKSNVAELVRSTTLATPTITQVSKNTSSITFTVRNNSNQAVDVTYGLTSPPTTTTLALNTNTTSANQTISGLDPDTSYTVFAQAKKTNYTDSAIASSGVTTDPIPTYTAATGGTTEEYNLNGKRYKSHTFTSNGTFEVTTVGDNIDDRNKVDYLIIAGGGGGAGTNANITGAGGAGAGGYRTTVTPTPGNTSPNSKITVTATSYSIIIGAGGAGITGSGAGNKGANSSALGITSTGGGTTQHGGGGDQTLKNGGSGAGGGIGSFGSPGGTGISGEGRDGGLGKPVNSAPRVMGGGGGAGATGENSTDVGGNGGNGLNNNLRTGSNETRGGGAGGSAFSNESTPGFGGSGGGADGVNGANSGKNGTANTGGGASSSGGSTTILSGGNGGSGIVIIRYEIAPTT